jgi:hypothetical protein
MLDDVVKLKEEVDRLTKKFSEFQDKPYLIRSKDLQKSIADAISPIFNEREKIGLIRLLVMLGIISLIFQGFVLWTLYFTVPLQ